MKISKLKKLLALAAVTIVTSSALFPFQASAAWKQDSTGWWNTEGNSYSIGWRSIDGVWYYFDSRGYMKTGWVKDGSTWYYLQPSGAMKTGWLLDNNAWYYLEPSGAMKTGLADVNGKTYYLSDSGAMKTGNATINGINYTFDANGEKLTSNTANTTTETPTATATTAATTIAPTTTAATADTSTATTETTNSTSGSGGSGGGGGSRSSTSSTSYYQSLYGNWTLGDCISSNMDSNKLPADTINTALDSYGNATVTIASTQVSILGVIPVSITSIKEGTMTSSEFKSKYNNVSFNDVGISGDTVKYVKVTGSNRTVTIFISDNDNVYALYKNLLYKIEKQ